MEFRIGNLWEASDALFAVTTSSTFNHRGELVLGAGAALQAKQRYPGIQHRPELLQYHLGRFGWYKVPNVPVGFFQSKLSWRLPATFELIEFSSRALASWISTQNPVPRIALNFPGIGLGRLAREDVLPILHRYLEPFDILIYSMENPT
jgi:hypothetical protein